MKTCSTGVCRSSQHCGHIKFTCEHLCILLQFNHSLACFSFYLHPFILLTSSPTYYTFTFSLALFSLCYSFESFHSDSCIRLLSFSLLFSVPPFVIESVKLHCYLSVHCFVCSHVVPNSLLPLIFLSQILYPFTTLSL